MVKGHKTWIVDAIVVAPAFVILLMVLWQYIPVPVCISLVSGESMHPTIESGSLTVGVSTTLIRPRIGDIVIARFWDHYIVHRIIHISDTYVITKGDGNQDPDPPISTSDVRYVVVAVIPSSISGLVAATAYFYVISATVYASYRIYLNTKKNV